MSVDAGEVLFRLTAQDLASTPLKAVQTSLAGLGQSAGKQTGALGGVTKAIGGLGSIAAAPVRALGGLIGSLGSLGLAGLGIQTAFAAVSGVVSGLVGDAMEAQQVLAATNAVIASTKGIAGVTASAVTGLANSLSKVTAFGDEAIQSAQNLLLTFTSIGKDTFPAATETVLNMSQALGQDLKSSATQLGKALQDPIRGVTALRRVGVAFTDAQLEQIKVMQESGDLMGAQKIILGELETEFGNAARAAGETFAGKMAQAKTAIGNVKEVIGNALLPVLTGLVTGITPVLIAFGEKLPAAFAAMSSTIGSVLNPAIAIVQKFLKYLSPSNDFDLMRAWFGKNFGPLIDGVVRSLKSLVDPIVAIGTAIGGLISGDLNLGEFLGELLSAALDHLGNLANLYISIGKLAIGLGAAFIEMVGNIDWAGVGQSILDGLTGALAFLGDLASDAGQGLLDLGAVILDAIGAIDWPAVGQSLLNGLTGALVLLGKAVSKAGKGLIDLGGVVLGAIASVDWPAVGKSLLDGLTGAIEGAGDVIAAVATWVGAQFSGIDWGGVWGTVTEIGQGLLDGLGDVGDGLVGWVSDQWAFLVDKWPAIWKGAGDIVGGLLSSVADFGGSVVTWVTEAWAFLADKWPGIWAGAGNIVMGLLASVVNFGGSIVTWITEAWAFLVDKWPAIWKGAGDIVGGLFAAAGTLLADVTTWLTDTWASIPWKDIWAAITGFGEAAVEWLEAQAVIIYTWFTLTALPAIETAMKTWHAALVDWVNGTGTEAAERGETETKDPIIAWIESVGIAISTAVNENWSKAFNLGAIFRFMNTQVADALFAIGDFVVTKLMELGNTLGQALFNIFTAGGVLIATGILSLTGVIITALTGLYSGVLGNIGENSPLFGSDMVKGFLKGFGDTVESAKKAVVKFFTDLIASVKDLLGISSPSSVFSQIGEDIVAGLVQGMAGLPAALADILATLTKWLADTALAVFAGAITIGQDMVEGLVNGTITLVKELATILGIITDWIVEAAAAILTGAVAMGTSLIDGFVDGLAGLAGALSGAIQSAFANIDIDFGVFHLHDGVITIDMPSIQLPSIGGGDTSGSSQAQAVPTNGNSAQGGNSSQSSQANSVTINYSPTTSAKLDPVADYRVLMSIAGVA